MCVQFAGRNTAFKSVIINLIIRRSELFVLKNRILIHDLSQSKREQPSDVSAAPVPVFVLQFAFDLLLIIQLHLQVAQFLLQCCKLWGENNQPVTGSR